MGCRREFTGILTWQSGPLFHGSPSAKSHREADGFLACRRLAKGALGQGFS
jgi:hypothetical protein